MDGNYVESNEICIIQYNNTTKFKKKIKIHIYRSIYILVLAYTCVYVCIYAIYISFFPSVPKILLST